MRSRLFWRPERADDAAMSADPMKGTIERWADRTSAVAPIAVQTTRVPADWTRARRWLISQFA
jgi:hypothetical protein